MMDFVVGFKADLPKLVTDPVGTGSKTLVFNNNQLIWVTQTGNLSLNVGTSDGQSVDIEYIIDGNGSGTLTLPSNWENTNGKTFDNSKRNYIYLHYSLGVVKYAMVKTAIPVVDLTVPTVVSRTVNTSITTQVIITCSESLASSTDISGFSISGKTISFLSISGSSIIITVSSAFTVGETQTISYSGSYIEDLAGNNLSTFTAQAIANNISLFSNTKSYRVSNINSILSRLNTPLFNFGNGVANSDFSVCFDLKILQSSSNDRGLVAFTSNVDYYWYIGLTPTMDLQLYTGGGGQSYRNYNTSTLSLNTSYRIVIRFLGSTGVFSADINGSSDSLINSSGGSGIMPAFSSIKGITLGGTLYGSNERPAVDTRLDNVSIVNKRLSDLEVSEYMNTSVNLLLLSFSSNIISQYLLENTLIDEKGVNHLTTAGTQLYESNVF